MFDKNKSNEMTFVSLYCKSWPLLMVGTQVKPFSMYFSFFPFVLDILFSLCSSMISLTNSLYADGLTVRNDFDGVLCDFSLEKNSDVRMLPCNVDL